MAKRRKKSLSQRAVGAASARLPGPLKRVLTSRIGAPLAVILLIALLATGVISVNFSGGRPRVSIDRERANAVREEVSELAHTARKGLQEVIDKRTEPVVRHDETQVSRGPAPPSEGPVVPEVSSRDTIRIASFNIQVLGTSKARKPHVMNVLADLIRRFDLIAIQELRTTDTSVMEGLLQLVNRKGARYQYAVGPRLGRSNSKEQYVFVFDPSRVELLPDTLMTVHDPQDLLHREPFIGRFRARTSRLSQPFTFILVNIHTDPDETDSELDALGDVFVAVQQNHWREDDVILLGDLNVNHLKMGKLGSLPDIAYTVRGEATNTRGTKSYDNIVFNQIATDEFTGAAAVLDFQQEYGLTRDQALEVSDHLPVWAEFRALEGDRSSYVALRPERSPTESVSQPVPSSDAIPMRPVAESPQRPGIRGILDRTKAKARETFSPPRQPR
jgi:deoxyribonuclease-1-like protein